MKPTVGEIDHKFGSMLVESNASRAKLFEFVEIMRHERENKSLYDARQFCERIRVLYQLATSHETMATNTCHFIKYCNL